MIEKHIILVGPLGVGKSTLGRNLARKLECDFFDTDREVEERTGVDLSWIFDVEGEPGFRKRETMILKELLQLSPAVIATGGGTIVEKENRQLLKTFGFVVYIDIPLNIQIERTMRNHYNRPLLRGGILKERVTQLYKERAPLYEEVADLTLKDPKTSYQTLIKKILKHIPEHHALGA